MVALIRKQWHSCVVGVLMILGGVIGYMAYAQPPSGSPVIVKQRTRLLAAATTTTQPGYYLTTNCFGHYHLDDNAADTNVVDSGVTSSNLGRLYGGNTSAKTATGKLGTGCFDLDGTGDYVDCGTGMGTAFGNSVTSISISCWFKIDTLANEGLLGISPGSGKGEVDIFVYGSKLYLRLRAEAFDKSFSFADTTVWHHLAFSYDGTTAKLWIDNTNQISSAFSTALQFSGKKLIMGYWWDTSYCWNGKIDEVVIYNCPFTDAMVNLLYNGGTGTTSDILLNP